MTGKRLQIFELLLVISVAFLPSIILSLYAFISGIRIYDSSLNLFTTYLGWILQASLSILLMFYVLYRQGKNYSSIGLKPALSGTDFLHAIGIIFIARLVNVIIVTPVHSFFPDFIKQASNPKNVGFLNTNFTFFLVVIMIIIPIQEETIVRGFTMTKVFDITNNKYLAVIVSVIIQFSYHLYQGLPSALLLLPYFIISALYFIRYGNLNAVILAHILIDLSYLLQKTQTTA